MRHKQRHTLVRGIALRKRAAIIYHAVARAEPRICVPPVAAKLPVLCPRSFTYDKHIYLRRRLIARILCPERKICRSIEIASHKRSAPCRLNHIGAYIHRKKLAHRPVPLRKKECCNSRHDTGHRQYRAGKSHRPALGRCRKPFLHNKNHGNHKQRHIKRAHHGHSLAKTAEQLCGLAHIGRGHVEKHIYRYNRLPVEVQEHYLKGTKRHYRQHIKSGPPNIAAPRSQKHVPPARKQYVGRPCRPRIMRLGKDQRYIGHKQQQRESPHQ